MSAINRIIIAGNGFDLAHGLNTSYEDFINWYWDQWGKCLLHSQNKVETDGLCSFRLNDNIGFAGWYLVWGYYYHTRHHMSDKEIVNIVKNDSVLCEFHENSNFFKRISSAIASKCWVDIEYEYYNELNNQYFKQPQTLNKEFELIKKNLIEYLSYIQDSIIKESILIPQLKDIIFAPVKINEVAISARPQLVNFLRARYFGNNDKWDVSIGERLGFDKDKKNLNAINEFSKNWGEQIEHLGIESVLDQNVIPEAMLYPNRLMLLNFNYTNTADLYFPQDENEHYWFPINHIHGKISDPSNIIFGYGDELDEKYKEIIKLNNNEYLQNIKSIKYLEAQNYRKLLSFIDEAPYQIYIMGHSCGISDRTLLNTLFEHKNCISIKPFYYKKPDNSDNYIELIQNISRNFTDMKLMRDRIVNKTYCEPLPQHN